MILDESDQGSTPIIPPSPSTAASASENNSDSEETSAKSSNDERPTSQVTKRPAEEPAESTPKAKINPFKHRTTKGTPSAAASPSVMEKMMEFQKQQMEFLAQQHTQMMSSFTNMISMVMTPAAPQSQYNMGPPNIPPPAINYAQGSGHAMNNCTAQPLNCVQPPQPSAMSNQQSNMGAVIQTQNTAPSTMLNQYMHPLNMQQFASQMSPLEPRPDSVPNLQQPTTPITDANAVLSDDLQLTNL